LYVKPLGHDTKRSGYEPQENSGGCVIFDNDARDGLAMVESNADKDLHALETPNSSAIMLNHTPMK
jgi:hypothetical protein